jgi:hypothetical protein
MIRRPFPATALALTALFVSLGGTSYAALSITGKDVKAGSLAATDFAAGQLPAGAAGPTGPQGPADNRHGIIGAQAATQTISADWRFLGAVQDFEFHSDCANAVVTFRISNTVTMPREVLIERWSATSTPAIEAISIPARSGTTNGTAAPSGTGSPFHLRVLAGAQQNAFVADLWGQFNGTSCDVSAIVHSQV